MGKNVLTSSSELKNVPLKEMRVSPVAQRELRPARVNELAAEFNPEYFEPPIVNFRDGIYWIIEGQHSTEALKIWLGDWETQVVNCRVYTGLTEKQEAEMFDHYNNQLPVSPFDRFKVRVTAERTDETNVKKIVEGVGLHITREKCEGAIQSVATLLKIYKRAGEETLGRALTLTHQSFGDPGLNNQVIAGIALVCERYNGAIDDKDAIATLQGMRGGVGSLLSKATTLRKQTGQKMATCVAAATVDTLNSKKGGRKIPSWWKE